MEELVSGYLAFAGYTTKQTRICLAHLHLGLLAYWVVNTIRHQLKQKDINNEWGDIARIMNTQNIINTTMDNDYDQQIVIRQCNEPTEQTSNIFIQPYNINPYHSPAKNL